MKTIDCSNKNAIYQSLKEILRVNRTIIDNFIKENVEKVKEEKGCLNREINIDKFFNLAFGKSYNDKQLLEMIKFDYVALFHLTTILDESSFRKSGLLNLTSLFEYDNPLKTFLKKYDIELVKEGKDFLILNSGEVINNKGFFLKPRIEHDRCINGFLFKKGIKSHYDVQGIKRCPEFLQNISEATRKPEVIDEWKRDTSPAIIKYRVKVFDMSLDTFTNNFYRNELFDNLIERYKFFYKEILRYLLLNAAELWDYRHDNCMVFLNENYNVPKDDILNIYWR